MAYADSIRSATATMNTVASLIEGIGSSTYPLTWTSYSLSATQAGSGSLTYSSCTWEYSKYIQIGKLVIWLFRGYGTTGGTGSYELRITLPVTAANVNAIGGAAWTSDGSSTLSGTAAGVSTTVVGIRQYNQANYTLGANRYCAGTIVYEAA